MAVNREFTGDTPAGMTFSTLAGNVGGGAQTPGFMGIGKVYLTSRKFLFAEGGHARLVWMPKDLKNLLAADLQPVLAEQGRADLLEKIADETVATDPAEIRRFMERVGHPALALPDLSAAIAGTAGAPAAVPASDPVPGTPAVESSASGIPGGAEPAPKAALPSDLLTGIGEELKKTLAREIVAEVMAALERRLGVPPAESTGPADPDAASPSSDREPSAASAPAAGEAIAAIRAFPVRRETATVPVHTVALGATKAEGGTRGRVLRIGGATAMPFHRWEGEMPHRPLVAMEVFDRVSEKYPDILRAEWGDLLDRPADMARACVERGGADLISVRLDGTHPEKGGRSPLEALALVREVLAAVDCPVIVTGHNHFETWNEVAREVARGCAGENLLLNWAEQENFRTIAGMALAYGHTVVAQSPIDVNIAKQTNILMTNMDLPLDRIVIDPLTGALGYGIEYCYSVMERIRQTGLGGDPLLAGPMIVCPGAECAKVKEYRAAEADFPAWGDRERRAALWELTTALALLYAGADLLVMYHPEAVRVLKKQILRLLDGRP
jgi:acetyl-CoA decarbonylase/synthase complex subunit delta